MNGLQICPVEERRPTGLWRSGSGRASWVWRRRRIQLWIVVGTPLRIGKPIGASRPWWWWRWWPSWWPAGKSKRWLSPGWPAWKPIRWLPTGWSAGKPKGHWWWDILVRGRWPPRRPSRRSGRRVVRVVVRRVVVAGVRGWSRGARGRLPVWLGSQVWLAERDVVLSTSPNRTCYLQNATLRRLPQSHLQHYLVSPSRCYRSTWMPGLVTKHIAAGETSLPVDYEFVNI